MNEFNFGGLVFGFFASPWTFLVVALFAFAVVIDSIIRAFRTGGTTTKGDDALGFIALFCWAISAILWKLS